MEEYESPIVGFAVENRSVTRYVRDSGEYERYDLACDKDHKHSHMIAVVVDVDLGGHYGIERNAFAYFRTSERKLANAMAKRLNAELFASK